MYTSSHMARQRIQRQQDEMAKAIAEDDIIRTKRKYEEREKLRKEDPEAYNELLRKEKSDRDFERMMQEREDRINYRFSVFGFVFMICVVIFIIYMVSKPI